MALRARNLSFLIPVLASLMVGCNETTGDANEDGAQSENRALRPDRRDADSARVASLSKPSGFRVEVFARDLGHARMIAVAADSTVYLNCPQQGQVKTG